VASDGASDIFALEMADKGLAMQAMIDRRLLLKTGIYGLGALSMPGGAMAAMQVALTKGFSHGVASGEPSQKSVLLWTRYVSDGAETKLRAEVAIDASFTRVVAGGEVLAAPSRDYTAKLTITGLLPGQTYHYRFIAPDGTSSPIGRTRTLPDSAKRYRLGVFSCSNLPFGWFNAYAHANAADDFDIALLLGDYLYEYQRGYYPFPKDAVADRLIEPAHEIVALADYRLRYASYRADPDLQRLHAMFPTIAMWDDHEFANDAWSGGAQNHQVKEGDWAARKRAAEQAWREWMPVRDLNYGTQWTSYRIADLANIFLTESRVVARSKQPSVGPLKGDDAAITKTLTTFRDGAWQDPARTMLGVEQEQWLASAFAANKTRWNLLAQKTLVGTSKQPEETGNWLDPKADAFVKDRVRTGMLAAKAGLPSSMDSWDGYPAARARTLAAAQAAAADLIVLTGDSHNAWAFDLAHEGKPAGVELGGTSVTSPGLETYFTAVPHTTIAKALVTASPELKWTNSGQRGYMRVELTKDKAIGEWRFVESVKTRSSALAGVHRMSTKKGRRSFEKL
jgi:alkaline phosphatase D